MDAEKNRRAARAKAAIDANQVCLNDNFGNKSPLPQHLHALKMPMVEKTPVPRQFSVASATCSSIPADKSMVQSTALVYLDKETPLPSYISWVPIVRNQSVEDQTTLTHIPYIENQDYVRESGFCGNSMTVVRVH